MSDVTPPDADVERALYMLTVAGKHCRENAPEDTTFYDGADCDGYCVSDDCTSAAEGLRQAVATLVQERNEARRLAEAFRRSLVLSNVGVAARALGGDVSPIPWEAKEPTP